LRDGKSLDEAVKASYSWTGAMRSIVDANVTHILIGAVLFIFGSGPKRFHNYIIDYYNIIVYFNLYARIFIDKNIAKTNLTFVTNFSKDFFTNFHFDF
jgi:SecD/SecF fusion protein